MVPLLYGHQVTLSLKWSQGVDGFQTDLLWGRRGGGSSRIGIAGTHPKCAGSYHFAFLSGCRPHWRFGSASGLSHRHWCWGRGRRGGERWSMPTLGKESGTKQTFRRLRPSGLHSLGCLAPRLASPTTARPEANMHTTSQSVCMPHACLVLCLGGWGVV